MSDSLWCHGLQHTRSPCPLLETNIYFCLINYKPFDYVDHSKLKDVEIPEQLTCLLRNLYAGLEATIRTLHGTTDWFQIGKGIHEGCVLSPYYLVYMQSVSCEIMDWMNHKLESRLLREISTTSDVLMIFAVVMSGCESWSVKKAECQRIDTFELWRRLLRVSWTARRTNQLIFKETNPKYSLERLMLKLKL